MNGSHRLLVISILVGIILMSRSFAQAEGGMHLLLKANDVRWTEGPPSMPRGAQVALIEGDLNKSGPFTFRIKLPPNYWVPPHTHPATEHVTVLSGTFYMGAGEKFDREKAVALTPGSFAAFPPGDSMFAWTEQETVVQVHGIGPWGINYINPADDPRNR